MRYTVLIPAYRPDEHLLQLADELTELFDSCGIADREMIVINDGSPEECEPIFHALLNKAEILSHPFNRGKGAAIRTGMEYLKERGIPCIVVTADADGQHLPEDILNCAIAAENDSSSLILGTRNFRQSGIPRRSLLGNRITEAVFRFSTRRHLKDTQTGLRAFHSSLIPEMLEAEGDRYEYEMNQLLYCVREGIPFREVPIAAVYEGNNEGSHFDPFRDSFLIYKNILRFALSGISSFAVDWIMFAFFSLFFTGPSGAIYSNIFARLISASFNYEVNRTYVFRNPEKRIHSLPRYALLAAAVLAVNTCLLYALNSLLGVPLLLAKVITEICIFVFSWVMQRSFVFARKGGAIL